MQDLKQYFEEKDFDNGFIRVNRQPHTKDIEALTSCCCGRTTGTYYFLCKYFGIEIDGEATLSEIAKLQDVDKASPTYGCLRWYREEPCIRDTNGAFFVLKPVAMALLFCPEKISAREREIILPVLKTAGEWFSDECNNYGYYYPNKIASDGAMLMAIGIITGDDELIRKAEEFWSGWLDYTDEYGWGWGENTSKCYCVILNDALELALCCMKEDSEIYRRLYKARSILLDYVAYHGEYEFVPSIRTYTFSGTVTATQGVTIDSLSPDTLKNPDGKIDCYDLLTLILHDKAPRYTAVPDESSFHLERIFGDSYAATYKGENIRLGTVSKFPVMPGCYQNDWWGLGWQSMPVSVLAKKHETSFLRFASVCEGKLRTHIAYNKHYAYLNTHMFSDENIPDVLTVCNQKDNTAVIVRTIGHLANSASYFADEWYFQHFDGELFMYNGWYVFDYGDCALAVMPVNGEADIIRSGENIRLAQKFYDGEEKLLVSRQWITAWAAVVIDNAENREAQLDEVKTEYTEIKDLRFPREHKPFKISCGKAQLDFEPYKNDLM